MTAPEVVIGSKARGVAGEFAYRVTVTYPGEDPSTVTFQGSDHGPPIVIVTPGIPRGIFVSSRVLSGSAPFSTLRGSPRSSPNNSHERNHDDQS